MARVGQNHIYTFYIRCFWQGNHQIYGHIQCIYTILSNPTQSCKSCVLAELVLTLLTKPRKQLDTGNINLVPPLHTMCMHPYIG